MVDIGSVKKHFPIFANNPGLIYLDNGATVQKPYHVLDAVDRYMRHDYANIHRGSYELAERSEQCFINSKKSLATLIGARPSEIVYTYNATYAFNIIASTLWSSGMLRPGDAVLINIADHHANIVPWQILARDHDIEVRFFGVTEDDQIDRENFSSQYDAKVKVVATTRVSNVTGGIYDIAMLRAQLRSDTYFIVDGSQAIQHFPIAVANTGADFLVRTGHKMMGLPGIGCIWSPKSKWQQLMPSIGGGSSIQHVTKAGFSPLLGSAAREPGTPNLPGAVSLDAACTFIEQIGGMKNVAAYEMRMTQYIMREFSARKETRKVLGSANPDTRIGTFTFVPTSKELASQLIGAEFAKHNICIRAGGHCAHPLLAYHGYESAPRMSTYIYNTPEDIDAFFSVLDTML